MYAPEGLSDEMASLVGQALQRQLAREYQSSRVNQSGGLAKAGKTEAYTTSIGQHKARIEPTSYHYWGKRLGYDCWSDRKFIKEYLRDNPESRIKSKGSKKAQAGYGGKKPHGYYDTPVGRVTFRKVYGSNPRVEVDANA
tara:strand:+ start:28585 stop:29004 length:420 start_codon:yes stop_codon:yes gene_type:complete